MNPPEFGVCGTLMQIVSQIFKKYCSEFTKTCHFKRKIQTPSPGKPYPSPSLLDLAVRTPPSARFSATSALCLDYKGTPHMMQHFTRYASFRMLMTGSGLDVIDQRPSVGLGHKFRPAFAFGSRIIIVFFSYEISCSNSCGSCRESEFLVSVDCGAFVIGAYLMRLVEHALNTDWA